MAVRHALAHNEIGCGFTRPRHPVVCAIDVIGILVTLGLLSAYPQKLLVASLPLSIVLLYGVSCLYHWLPAHPIRQKADHLMIAAVIDYHYLPFWGTQLPMDVAIPRSIGVAFIFCAVCIAKIRYIEWEKVGHVLFVMLGLYGIVFSYEEVRGWVSFPGVVLFWMSIILYVAQLAIYSSGRPYPLWFGFIGNRELQHVALLVATTSISVDVLVYLHY